MKGDGIQPVIKIRAKYSFIQGLVDIDIRGGQDAYVHGYCPASTQAAKLLILQHVKQLGLQCRGHLPDFVEQNRSVITKFKLARFRSHRSRKRTRLVSKKFAFQEF